MDGDCCQLCAAPRMIRMPVGFSRGYATTEAEATQQQQRSNGARDEEGAQQAQKRERTTTTDANPPIFRHAVLICSHSAPFVTSFHRQ